MKKSIIFLKSLEWNDYLRKKNANNSRNEVSREVYNNIEKMKDYILFMISSIITLCSASYIDLFNFFIKKIIKEEDVDKRNLIIQFLLILLVPLIFIIFSLIIYLSIKGIIFTINKIKYKRTVTSKYKYEDIIDYEGQYNNELVSCIMMSSKYLKKIKKPLNNENTEQDIYFFYIYECEKYLSKATSIIAYFFKDYEIDRKLKEDFIKFIRTIGKYRIENIYKILFNIADELLICCNQVEDIDDSCKENLNIIIKNLNESQDRKNILFKKLDIN